MLIAPSWSSLRLSARTVRTLRTTADSTMYRSVPFNVVKMMPMMDAFSYQPITSVSRIAPPSDDVIARIADGLRIPFNLFNPRSISANGVPVRSHLRHSKDSKRLNKASSVTEDARRVFSLLSCFMVLQGSGLQEILGIFDFELSNAQYS